ncbi:MAG: hypothetical protein IT204_04715 [Fimbriimonadaceae bacterium]|nr:hypothetical protein [Fimbriimonadaceae bacterium]
MRTARHLAAPVILATLLLAPAARAQQTVEWTVLVYHNGDNSPGQVSLEEASIRDFNEMEAIGSSADVNVVVQWDRNTGADTLDVNYGDEASQSWTTTRRYLVLQDPNQVGVDPNAMAATDAGYRLFSPALLDLGETDMGQEDTLVEFCQWAFARFPARHYLLVLNDTGQGWQPRSRGLIFDASTTGDASENNAAVFITNDELRSALTRIKALRGSNLDALALDAGGQDLLEVVYQCRETCDYLVAPFLNRPLGGFPYNDWLADLTQSRPTTAIALETTLTTFAGRFHSSYGAGSNELGGAQSTALGVLRMNQIEAVKTAVDSLATTLLASLNNYATPLLRVLGRVQTGRTSDFTATSIDLAHFAALTGTEITDPNVVVAASGVSTALTAAVVNPQALRNSVPGDLAVGNFNGLGIYFPQVVTAFDTAYQTSCDLVDLTQWDELVQGLLTLNSDQNGPEITISSPLPGATIIDNPPTIVATIVDRDTGGRVNPTSITISVDGVAVAASAFTFDSNSGILTYVIPAALTVTSHTFTIAARDLSGNLSSATGNFRIAVPSLAVGVQTFSLPRLVSSALSDPTLVFGRDNFTLVRWVPSLFGSNKYRVFPDSFAGFRPPDAASTLLRPTVAQPPAGLGYWVRVRQSRPLPSLPGSAVTGSEYRIQLYRDPDGGSGWNMIANPFDVSAVGLAACQVEQSDGRRITFRQAIDQRLTPGVLFTYVANSSNPNAAGRYDFQNAGEGQLTRLQGHWLRANQDFTLIVTNGSRAVAASRASRPAEPLGGWSVALQATAGDLRDTVQLGASGRAADGYDTADVAGPPVLPGGLQLRVLHADWGVESGRYVRDWRGPGALQSWELELAGPAATVQLSWPQLQTVPAGVELLLTDLQNGQQRRLRSTAGYQVVHDGSPRLLRVTAQSGGASLLLSDLRVTPGRGLSYQVGATVSREAQLQVLVRSLGGRLLREVSGQAQAGRATLSFDGRGPDGLPLPNGVYRVELLATAVDGSVARQQVVLRVTR